MLHVSIYYKSPASQVFHNGSKELDITEHEAGTVGRVVHNLLAVAP
jgi:hypothetical protein